MKREIPILIVGITGVIMFFQYFVPTDWSMQLLGTSQDWVIVIGILALPLGIWSLIKANVMKLKVKGERFYAAVLLAGFLVMLIFGLPHRSSLEQGSTFMTLFTHHSYSYSGNDLFPFGLFCGHGRLPGLSGPDRYWPQFFAYGIPGDVPLVTIGLYQHRGQWHRSLDTLGAQYGRQSRHHYGYWPGWRQPPLLRLFWVLNEPIWVMIER